MKKTLSLFFVTAFSLLVCACGGTYGGYAPWPTNSGIVTKDPDSVPNIAWQTSNQRNVLIRQDQAFGKDAAPAADPARPSLQTVIGGAALPPKKVTVALLLPLSGKSADIGQSMLKAAQMALFDVGSNGFELVPQDTKSTPEGAAQAARQAVTSGADMLLGPVFADDVKAVKPIAGNTPVIAFTTDWTLAGSNTYIMGFLPFAQIARVAQFTQSKGQHRFAVYAPQTPYCDVVISTLQRTGADIVRVGRYSPMQSDLSDIVKDFVETSKAGELPSFNALVLPVGGESLKSVVSIFDLHGISNKNVRMIGTGLWDDPSLPASPSLYGGWFAAPDPSFRRDFERRYQENYGQAPLRLASLAYDATALAAVLARSTGGHDAYSRANLTNPRGFAGIDGVFRFRPDGLSERGLAVLEIQAGKTVIVDPAPTAFISSGS